jgi:hypothetical protein
MKHLSRILSVAVIAAFAAAAPTLAFHDAGVAHCNGCHTMHASEANPADDGTPNQFLLKESNSTDTCVRCHDTSYGNTWGASVDAPGNVYGGGQFVFLLEDNLNDGHNGGDPARWIDGDKAGHNVISVDKGTAADATNATGPGGTYNSSYLHCTSCHDPHGQGGHFRLLYGNDYPESNAFGYDFNYTNPAPEAAGIRIFGPGESNSNHTAFNNGMSEWCANCHGDFHNTSYPTNLVHPSGAAMGADIAANYNIYEGTGHYTGDGSDAYLALVPFEDPAMTTEFGGAANGTSKVMCLSCHRAHASSGPYAGRWDFNATVWAEEGVESGSYAIPNPYAATAGADQRSLCNKCHAKDPEIHGGH